MALAARALDGPKLDRRDDRAALRPLSCSWDAAEVAGVQRTAIRETPGHELLEQLQPLAGHARCDAGAVPVTFPPGRARLATSPSSDRIADDRHDDGDRRRRLLARPGRGAVPTATMTSTLSRTSSAASPGAAQLARRRIGTRSRCSGPRRSPSSRSPCAEGFDRWVAPRSSRTRGSRSASTFPACCASAASGAARAPASEVSRKRRRSMLGWWGRRRSGVNVEDQATAGRDLDITPVRCEGWLLDHLIRPRQQRRWDREAERLGGLQVDHEVRTVGCSTGRSAGFAPLRILST